MKITAYLINGIPVSNLEKWTGDQLNGNPSFKMEESVSSGYEDITSIISWDKSGFLDWSRRRDEIVPLFYSIAGLQLENFSSLSIEEKLIGCKYFLIPLEIRTQIISDAQDSINWEFLLIETKISRVDCIESMRKKVGECIRIGSLTLEQTQIFFKDVFQYINWFIDTNSPEFKMWITNEVGTKYESDGFEQKEYYSLQLKNDLMEIYNGKY